MRLARYGWIIVNPFIIVNNRDQKRNGVLLYRFAFIGYTSSMGQQEISEQKIKIVYVVESFSTGVYAIVRDIACNLDPDRFEVLILHSLRSDSPKQYHEDLSQSNISLQYIPMGSSKDYLRAIQSIRSVIKAYQPDCIHLHSSKAGFLGRLAAKRSCCSHIVYSPHGFAFLRTDVGPIKRWLFFQLEYWINRYMPSKIIAVSEGEREQALKVTNNTVTINNFIDTTTIHPDKPQTGFDIVTTGRIAPQKNPQLFNQIATALSDRTFLWVGDGPLRSELKSANISVTGYIPRAEAIAQVERAKVYLQTSLWEGMPVSILEAMAAGKAVVASNIIGNRDLINSGKTGILCDPNKPEEFISTLSDIIQDSDIRESLGKSAREHVVANHDVKVALECYMQIYKVID